MNREQLFDLTGRVRLVAGAELPVIVGSQSLYGVTPHVPDIVKRSVECDFLLLAVGPPAFRAVIEQIGFARLCEAGRGVKAGVQVVRGRSGHLAGSGLPHFS